MAAITEVVSLVLVDSSFMQLVPGTVKLVTKLILWTHLQPLTWHWIHLLHQALLSGPNTWLELFAKSQFQCTHTNPICRVDILKAGRALLASSPLWRHRAPSGTEIG